MGNYYKRLSFRFVLQFWKGSSGSASVSKYISDPGDQDFPVYAPC